MARRLLATALGMWLVGCAMTPTIEAYRSLPQTSALKTEDGGLIIGIEIGNLLSLGREVYRLEFWQIDTDRRLLIDPQHGGKVVGLTRGSALMGRDERDGVEYILQDIPAGTYFLAYVNWGDHGHSAIGGQSIAFEVKPGTVTYLGDFGFDTPLTVFSNVDLRVLPRRTDAAQNFLQLYPRVSGNLWNQQPIRMSLACDLSGSGIKGCLVPR